MKRKDVDIVRKARPKITLKRKKLIALYGFILADGGYQTADNTACHAGLRRRGKTAIAVVNSIPTSKFGEKEERTFLEWLFNFSPYEPAIHTRSANKALSDGYYVCDTDVPGNLLGGACIAERMLHENAYNTEVWFRLVERGVNPDVAFVLCSKLAKNGDSLIWQSASHCCLPGYRVDKTILLNFAKHKMVNPIGTYRKTNDYGVSSSLWLGGDPKGTDLFMQLKSSIGNLGKKGKKKNNPFDMGGVKVNVPFEEAIEEISPEIIEWTKKNVG